MEEIKNIVADKSNEHTEELNLQHYSFIYDIDQIKKFAQIIDLSGTHSLILVSRKKYDSDAISKCLFSKLITNISIDEYINNIEKLEVPIGCYKSPQSAMVIYCSTNHKNVKLGVKRFMEKCLEASFGRDDTFYDNAIDILKSEIASTKKIIKIVSIDIDSKDDTYDVLIFIKQEEIVPLCVIETKNGHHILLESSNNLKNLKNIYAKYSNKHNIGDIACPIPGTIQAGFPVQFVDF